LSLYADEIFLRPTTSDFITTTNILGLYGEALGLKTNMAKSSVTPIQCVDTTIAEIQDHLLCLVESFPIKYLRLPLSVKKLTKPQLQPLIDHLADLLLTWKADLITRAGHATQVQFVFTVMIIYHATTLDLPRWAQKEIDKIWCGYL
jgi:hypothetical protein